MMKSFMKIKPLLQAKTWDYVVLVDYANENNKEISYATDEKAQAQYIKMLNEEGKKALLFPHIIDIHFISFLEMKEQWKFSRIDTIPQQTSDNEQLVEIFKKNLKKDDLKITTSPLKSPLPALIVHEEHMRRISDFSKMFGNTPMPETITLVLNSENKLIKHLPGWKKKSRPLFAGRYTILHGCAIHPLHQRKCPDLLKEPLNCLRK